MQVLNNTQNSIGAKAEFITSNDQHKAKPMKVYLEGIGCERRLLELSKFREYFRINGYTLAKNAEQADHIVLVTCAFKHEEEKKSVHRLESLSKLKGRLFVYGCLPAISPSKLINNGKIRYLSTKDLSRIDEFFDHITVKYADIPDPRTITEKPLGVLLKEGVRKIVDELEFSEKFFVEMRGKIENRISKIKPKTCDLFICRGCNGQCSYCAIRFAIGPCKSKSVDMVMAEFASAVDAGFNQFKLVGDDVGAYGLDNNSSFGELLTRLTDQSRRLRNDTGFTFFIDGIHPKWVIAYRREIEEFLATGMLKEFMCPTQSGNDKILKIMRRSHTADEIGEVLTDLLKVHPDVRVNTEVIVGFPSETRTEFMDTLLFLKNTPFSSVTIFPYDDKEKAPSSKLQKKVSADEIDSRLREAVSYLRKQDIKVYLNCPHKR
jgi:MiaB/RimO family radical SAM methylthiotransferase